MTRSRSSRTWIVATAALTLAPLGGLGCSGASFSSRDTSPPDAGTTVDATDEAPENIVISGPDGAVNDAAGRDAGSDAPEASVVDAEPAEAGPECVTGTSTCQHDDVVACTDAGVWSAPVPCATGTPYCVGAGACAVCTPGTTECSDSASVQTCNSVGSWGAPTSCTDRACLMGACTGTCAPGTTQCGDGGVQTCSTAGQWGSASPCAQGVCQGGGCVGNCTPGSAQCSGNGAQVCGANGQWGSATQCNGRTCVGGECAGVCAPSQTQCTTGNAVQGCGPGGQWGSATACANRTCLAGQCQGVCAPGQSQCNGAVPQSCDPSSGQWISGAVNAGQCGAVCTPGAVQCASNGIETCSASGQWGAPAACNHQTCVAGACTGVCAPTDKECSGNGVASCGPAGQWGTSAACTDQTCLSGACSGVCAPGQSQCSGAVPQSCNASDGQWASGAVTAGQCGAVCTPGAVQCSGNGVETCGATGQWGSAAACTGQTPLCMNGACAPCTGGMTACDNACVNEQTDASNCGACGHGCLGGACSGGICQPVTLVPTSNAVGGHIAVDSGNVYWDGKGQLLSCSVGGNCGTGTVVYSGPSDWAIFGFAIPSPNTPYDGFIYVGNLDDNPSTPVPYVEQINRSTLAVTTVALSSSVSNPVALAFDSVNTWLYVADSETSALERFKTDGSQYSVVLGSVATLPSTAQTIALDANNVYVSGFGGTVYYCPLIGSCGAGSVALSGLGLGLEGVFSDGTHIWAAASGGGAVYECVAGKGCGTPTPLAAGQAAPRSVVADTKYVYWADSTQIMRCPVTGCAGNPEVYVSGINAELAWMLALDDTALYWNDALGIRRVAK